MNDPLECVIVCDGYGDFLSETLPYTRRAVDRIVVVTGRDDSETQRVCSRLDVHCLRTWVHKRESTFDKAAAINHGLAHLSCRGLLLHLDADIVIPSAFRWWRAEHKIDRDCVYGVDRYDCCGWDQWQKVKRSDWAHSSREWGYLIHPPANLNPCSRVGHRNYGGWVPIGFFQLWHGSRFNRYPIKPGADGEHTDLLHGAQWEPEKRRLIPDFKVVHLCTDGKPGANWHGRTTPRFGPPQSDHCGKGY